MSKRHEQLLFRYSSALERGDFQSVADVLREAERDPALEQMILDMNDAYSAERFNHTNPKEIPMIAALYQNQRQMPRYRWQGLPFVAALAVIALLSVMLAIQTRGSIPVNSGGNDSPVAQISPYCTGTLISTFTTIPLYSRPALDAPVVTELQYTNNAGREIVVLDVTSVDSESWVFVRVPSSPDVPFGWTTETQLRSMVADCRPTLVPVEAVVQATATVTASATVELSPLPLTLVSVEAVAQATATATPMPIIIEPTQIPPTVVPPDTIIPANEQSLSTFTATPIRMDIEATAVIAASVMPEAALSSVEAPVLPMNEAAACETQGDPNIVWLILYSRPTTTSLVVAGLIGPYNVNDFAAKDSTEVDGQKWLYISTGAPGMSQGWVTQADFNRVISCFRENPGWQPTIVPPEAAEPGVSIAATNLASYEGNCKTTTLAAGEVRAFPEWDSMVVATLPEDTLVSAGAFAMSTDAQGNLLRWYVVGFQDIRGWMPESLLDMSVCLFSEAPLTPVLPTVPPPAQVITATPIPTPTPIQ